MNPYLHSPVISPQEFHDSTEQQDLDPGEKDGDHPPGDDEGHGHSFTILPQSRSRTEDEKLASLPGSELASAVGESPSASGKANLNVSRREGQDDSFLQDSSSNDGRSGRTSPNNSSLIMKYRDENARPSTTASTPAFAREMLGENQRQWSCEPATGKDVRAVGTNTIGVPKALSPESQNVSARGLSPKAATGTATDQEWVVTPLKPRGDQTSPGNSSRKSSRVWIQPTASEEQLRESNKLSLLLEGTKDSARASGSSASDYKSATDVPVVQIDDQHTSKNLAEQAVNEAIVLDQNEPTSKDREQAKKVYDGDEEFVTKARAAAWLGESSSERGRVRKAYMELFEWADLNILYALRGLCGKVILKGETQQVDRILDTFSTRWSECNPDHGFKATDVVHTICYSILLLNTDLHLAEIEQKMTRAQFIKNTMPTIRRVAADAAPDAFETIRPSRVAPRPQLPWTEPVSPSTGSTSLPHEGTEGISSAGTKRPTNTLLTRPSDNSEHDQPWNQTLTPLDYDTPHDDCGPLVKAPFNGKMSTWEVQVEIVLKDFFNTIRQQPLPLNGAPNEALLDQPMPTNSLSAFTGSLLRRTPSTLSKAASETIGSRGRVLENRLGTGRWTSKTRSRPRLNPTSTVASSRTSFDDESSMWSPSVSSTWSKYSLGKTQTSMSVDSLGSEFHQADYQQSIGFANALSQAIIREETAGSTGSDDAVRVAPFLEDETLELAGAPWAKEGILKHKHHLEVVDKKAKDRNWNECFAVIEKGYMRLFSFNMNSKSLRQKTKNQRAGGVVGGGNWSENAEALGTFLLRQTIASALPPPGYSKTRPHVWALSLPSGAVHLFQVGTPEIVKEFVSTANYWSARLSKEPLIGGISNIEHGWSNAIINTALVQSDDKPHSTINHCQRPSLQSSIRSSLDQGSVRPKLPGDKGIISDWSPPQQSMVASALMEIDQLKALTTYVKNVEEELQRHNELRGPMLLAFSSRHPNSSRAMANWERKSSYLLKEIVKFRTYIDCLNAAQLQKQKLYASRVPSEQSDEAKKEGRELTEAATG
ncbi:MAG: hypothetical protein M1830_009605 [Pleopsidium flavum]|nr:MAG: hypothetical protein M1830_009605 [Pleopsidium flavum]